MKGPYERLKYDLRRLWDCPKCHRRERTDGSVTYLFCSCEAKNGGQPIVMTLVEEAGHRTVPPIKPNISEELLAAAPVSPAIETPPSEPARES